MSVIQVAIPVLKGRSSIVVDKGRPWSVVEHMILEALAKCNWTAIELSKAAKMPRRVVIEAIIRLMRAGWVDLSEARGTITFHANSFGLANASKSELPKNFERIRRQINFTIDLVEGGVFRNHEWYVFDEYSLREREKTEVIVWIQPEAVAEVCDRGEFYETLLDYDEALVSAEPSGFSRKYILVAVRNGIMGRLPDREMPALRAAIVEAARSVSLNEIAKKNIYPVPGLVFASRSDVPEVRQVHFDITDLVLDGEAHRVALSHVFENAKKSIFIHSTFINEAKVLAWLPEITSAAKRGVKTHVFWGQSEDTPYVVSSRTSISNLTKNRDVQNLGEALVIYPFSTKSHAKLIVADSGKGGSFIAVVGSCNWFTSGFDSYEASVLLRDPHIVRDVVRYFAELSVAHNGVWSPVATELINISKALQDTPTSPRANAKASIVIGAQHGHFVLEARDTAKRRIFAASHRLGPVSDSSVITPIMTGARANNLKANVYFGRTTGAMWGNRPDGLIDEAAKSGVSIETIETPRLHAKMLAWDDDFVLVTSLNWLSAVSNDLGSPKEIGVYIEAKGVAETLIANFEGARGAIYADGV
ncbi:phospholipase D-like domain-containing protein [Glaciimonas sp. PCH181]|uniref:phospholipase D-like domain-containing protein n=1 Tax=Glaciimonas sp. PCH181 TaxID=2133943 RepID=UPI000D36D59B|nr:phospholipase D-like domain-containing protein [Glaciimonas sp. PCH181]PUA17643.1 hypothetical protein C7W93_17330 [Glaciimonas sp. PCH181]